MMQSFGTDSSSFQQPNSVYKYNNELYIKGNNSAEIPAKPKINKEKETPKKVENNNEDKKPQPEDRKNQNGKGKGKAKGKNKRD